MKEGGGGQCGVVVSARGHWYRPKPLDRSCGKTGTARFRLYIAPLGTVQCHDIYRYICVHACVCDRVVVVVVVGGGQIHSMRGSLYLIVVPLPDGATSVGGAELRMGNGLHPARWRKHWIISLLLLPG